MVKTSYQLESESYDPIRQSSEKTKSLILRKKDSSKNLLKNICIPIIKYLEEKGQLNVLTHLKISKKEIQVKNSVSAQIIYKILTHPYIKSINKNDLFKYINAKISCNPKVMKKPFHLKFIQELLKASEKYQFAQLKQFKACLSKIKKKVFKHNKKIEPIFQHGSLIQYVLILFYNHFQNEPFSKQQQLRTWRPIFAQNNQNQMLYQNFDFINQSTQLSLHRIKNLQRKIVQLFNNKTYNKQAIQKQQNDLTNTFQTQFKNLNIKYHLFDYKILEGFQAKVMKKCVEILKQKKKLTVNSLDKLVKSYFSSIFSNLLQQQTQNFSSEEVKNEKNSALDQKRKSFFVPVILIPSEYFL